jgi:mannose-6-phosphate isomerase-like protein (cupin superfamily)
MNITAIRTASIAGLAFLAGLAVAHGQQPAAAALPSLQAAAIDVGAIQPADLPAPTAALPTLRQRPLVTTDGTTMAVQIGTVGKHFHADANEIQIVIAGGGTEWLGDKQVTLKPGMMLVIPAGTPHAGTTDPNLKIIAIKTPPQSPTDIHFVP